MSKKKDTLQKEKLQRQKVLDGFYRAFEDRFRGSQKEIRRRLEVYLPFIEPIKLFEEHPFAVDIGCGRGEWLELLRDSGFDAQGIDLDERMLLTCHERGLAATKGDAIEFLENLPDGSCNIVSGFHIAEHLPFPRLQILVYEALRVLRPGGLLILETPNPENIRVSSLSFHLDPTHLSPIPPGLLAFLPEFIGFQRTKVIRLQGDPDLLEPNKASLEHVLTGVSPDYAVVSQKALDDVNSQLFTEVFSMAFGLDNEILIKRFDRKILDQAQQLSELREQTLGIVEEQRHIFAALNQRFAEQQDAAASLEARITAIYTSTSWRLTKPLRLVGETGRWLIKGAWAWLSFMPGSRPRRVARRVVVSLASYVLARPALANTARRFLLRHPAIQHRLKTIIGSGLIQYGQEQGRLYQPMTLLADGLELSAEPAGVRRIFQRILLLRQKSI